MWTAWLIAASAADCDTASLRQALEASEAAMEALDPEALTLQVGRARGAADCALAPVGPDLAARLYRSLGVLAYVSDRRPDLAAGWFLSAKRADPQLRLTDALAGPVQQAFDAVDGGADPRAPVESMPETWTLRVDGMRTTALPITRPYLMQWVREGEVRSRLVDGVPPLAAPADPVVAPAPVAKKERSLRTPLLVASGVSAGVAVACLGGSLAQNGSMRNAEDLDALDAALGRQRVFATGFWVFAAGSVGLGIGGVL